jgi:hypothetical protein
MVNALDVMVVIETKHCSTPCKHCTTSQLVDPGGSWVQLTWTIDLWSIGSADLSAAVHPAGSSSDCMTLCWVVDSYDCMSRHLVGSHLAPDGRLHVWLLR